ncbi:putative RNA-directed DNA polymerase [Tanacetum coccineum]
MAGDSGKSADKTKEGGIDHDSPYYLHPSDYPRQMHVNDVLNDGNYADWSQEMLNFLFAKNKAGFINGSIKKPEEKSSEFMPWMRCDAMIKGWLHTAMEKEIRSSVKYAMTAREIWVDLKERFGKVSAPRAYELKRSLTCTCSGCDCDIGKKLQQLRDKERLYEFLLGLDAEYGTIRTQILAMNPVPSLGNAYHLVAEDEQQRAIAGTKRPSSDSVAFQAQVTAKRDQSRPKQKDVKRSSSKPVGNCTNCGKDGHNRDGCFELIGYPDWWPGKGKQDKAKLSAACVEAEKSPIAGLSDFQYQQFLKFFRNKEGANAEESGPKANLAGNIDKEGKWIFDSGTTEHITHNDSLLKNKRKRGYEQPVTIPNGEAVPVEGRGECALPSGAIIKDVLHVPKFKCNLLSVSRLSKELQCAVTFFPEFCIMQDLYSRTLIGAGDCEDGLYKMGMFENNRHAMMTTQTKFTRLPFPISVTKTNACFELIHCDIWGKYRTPSLTRANYFLTIVDDFSRSVWVFLLKHKDQASICLVDFHKMVKVQFEKNIKRIRCDNGGEFVSNKMIDFYAREGIVLETSCPHTPQQNGVVERKHRHLLETARALKFEANLPTRFWGECVLTAAHVINRLPSEVIENKTPYEILHNSKPNYDHMKVFGCLAYYRSVETKGDKFEVRGRPGVFLGYPPGTKGYKVYDLQHRKMVTSRDVKFLENIFPFARSITEEEEIFVFPQKWDDENDLDNNGLNQTRPNDDIDEHPSFFSTSLSTFYFL